LLIKGWERETSEDIEVKRLSKCQVTITEFVITNNDNNKSVIKFMAEKVNKHRMLADVYKWCNIQTNFECRQWL